MSSIIRARNGDRVVSFRCWSAELSRPSGINKNTPVALIPDFATHRTLGDSRSVQPWLCQPAIRKCARSRCLRSELPDYGFQSGRGLVSTHPLARILVLCILQLRNVVRADQKFRALPFQSLVSGAVIDVDHPRQLWT